MIIEFDAATLVAASILGLTMGLIFVLGRPRDEAIPRWLAHVIGTFCIFLAFAALYLVVRGQAQPVIDLAILILAAAVVPTAGRAWMYWQDHQQMQRAARDRDAVALAELQARKSVD